MAAFPPLVLSRSLFGGVPLDTGLATLLFAGVNLHHFVLDGAIAACEQALRHEPGDDETRQRRVRLRQQRP